VALSREARQRKKAKLSAPVKQSMKAQPKRII